MRLDVSENNDHDASVRRYLVTGCAGFIGSHLAETLLANGDAVVGIDAFTDYYARELKEANLERARKSANFTFVEGDLTTAPLTELVDDVKGVFHLAAQPGVRGSWGETFAIYARDNIVATQRLFEAAAARGVRVVWSSTSSVYGNAASFPTREDAVPRPISPYGVTKLGCEHLAAAYAESFGLDQVSLRYFTVYGPRQRPDMGFTLIIRALLEGKPFSVYGTGEQSRDVTFVLDAVSATIAAMERGVTSSVYNVGGGSETTLNEVIEAIERISGRQLERIPSEVAAGDVKRTSADTSRARSDLDWAPKTPIEEGLAAQVEWVRAVGG
jgi:UDP-glucose 4-epimerase